MQDSSLAFSSTLKMKAIFSFKISVDFQWAIKRYIPEDRILIAIEWLTFLLHVLFGYAVEFQSRRWIEATYSLEKSVDFQRTTRRYFPEERTLHNYRCENLKCYRWWMCCMTFRSLSTTVPERRPLKRVMTVGFFPYSLLFSHSNLCAFAREELLSWAWRQKVTPKLS
jgi:hypothetical protein